MTWALLFLASLCTCLGQLAQKLAVVAWQRQPTSAMARLRSPWLWLAVLCLGVGLLIWLLVLQRLDVGIAYPMLSLNFVLITLLARYAFGEAVDARHWSGVALIMVGVALMGVSS